MSRGSTLAGRRVVITAGGTQQPLDDVRTLTNVSTGRLGASLAEECLRRGALVEYVHGRGALLPFRRVPPIDLRAGRAAALALVAELPFEEAPGTLALHEIRTVEDLMERLRALLTAAQIAVVIHAMAVSDYTAAAQEGKISSDQEELVVRLRRAPKVIGLLKAWAPGIVQVGFKLLSGASPEELCAAGLASGRHYGSDLTVANDLRSITPASHPVVALWPDGRREWIEQDVSRRLIDLVESLVTGREKG